MRGTVLYGARDVRYEEVPEPKILKPTDAIIRLAATCVCGSDLCLIAVSIVSSPTG
jgi:threonine dehydrogenase-like Zn-dependent dehydrogenase